MARKIEQLYELALTKVKQYLGEDYDDAHLTAMYLLYDMGTRVEEASEEDVLWADKAVYHWARRHNWQAPFSPSHEEDWDYLEWVVFGS